MKLYGKAEITGIDGTVGSISGVAAVQDRDIRSLERGISSNISENLDKQDKIAGFRVSGRKRTLNIEFTPQGTSTTNTKANAKEATILWEIPTKVTLSGFTDASTAQINGDWIYLPDAQSQSRSAGQDPAKMRLSLVQYVDIHGTMTLDQLITEVTS